MRLLKPSWVSHDGHPIFCIDVHPDGSRMATGGPGETTGGKVVVWNMEPIRSAKSESSKSVPKLLCQMDNHLACVNCLRWSRTGQYLASGGDDKIVIVWTYVRGAGPSFGMNGKNVEQWRCRWTLTGHQGDILDLAWSVDDTWLASCSVDNTIIVWNGKNLPEQIKTLRAHYGMVKGVTFDPIGKYLASQSDDKSLRIWRTQDWHQDAIITEPFQECGGTTHVLRLDWSPDGSYVVSAHAMNNNGPTAQIVERTDWRTKMDFVGHRKAVTCVRFNTRLFKKKLKQGSSKTQQYCCCALGSRDRSLSIWLTALKRPLVVVHDLFTNSVMDLSWTRRGMELVSCSMDGTVAYVCFSEDELGAPCTDEELSQYHAELYGGSLLGKGLSKPILIESPALLHLHTNGNADAGVGAGGDMNGSAFVNQSALTVKPFTASDIAFACSQSSSSHKSKQIETRLADGRRRITPILLEELVDEFVAPAAVPSNNSQSSNPPEPTFSSAKGKSRIVVEQQNSQSFSPPSVRPTDVGQSPNTKPATQKLAGETTPTSKASGPAEHVGFSAVTKAEKKQKSDKRKLAESRKSPEKKKKKRISLTTVERYGPPTPQKRVQPAESAQPKPSAATILQDQPPRSVTTAVTTKLAPVLTPAVTDALATPELQPVLHVQLATTGISGSIDVHNNTASGAQVHFRSEAPAIQWKCALHSQALLAIATSQLVAVACRDCTLVVMSVSSGRRLLPPFGLSSPAHSLTARASHVLVLLIDGNIQIWDMRHGVCTLSDVNVWGALKGAGKDKLRSITLTPAFEPLVRSSLGRTSIYNSQLKSWLVLSDSSNSALGDTEQLIVEAESKSAATRAQASARPEASRLNSSTSSAPLVRASALLQRQSAAALLRDSSEFKRSTLALAACLVANESEPVLRELCDELVTSDEIALTSDNTSSQLLPLLRNAPIKDGERSDLLKELLSTIGSNIRLQRLYTELSDQI